MPRPNKGPYLDTAPTGIYEIRWTERGRSKRRSTGTSNFEQAQKILAHFILLKDREDAIEAGEILMVSDILGDVEAKSGFSYWHSHVVPHVTTVENHKIFIRHLMAHFGSIEVKSISANDVLRYSRARENLTVGKRRAGPGTIRRELGVLIAAINWAVKNKLLSRDDVPSIARPASPAPKDRWLAREEAERLLKEARGDNDALPDVYKFIVLVLATASRKQAVYDLERSQIDLERGMIYLNPTGRRQTRKRRPPIPIADWFRPILEQILEEAKGKRLLNGESRNKLGRRRDIEGAFAKICEKAGLEGVTPHVLRHTWGTWAAQAGVPLADIGGVMGDDIETVYRNYLHHCPEHLRKAVNSIHAFAA